jgi:PAS domain S-box-containing protein
MEKLAAIAFMPHGMCYLWKPWLVGLHVASNGIIALSYFSIPLVLVYILHKRPDIPFNGIFLLFAGFILFCGAGHTFDIWTLWHPNYWISIFIRLLTALVSLATAIVLANEIPAIVALPSPRQMKDINQQLTEKITELEAQKALIRDQEEFLRSIYDNVQEAIFVVDIEADNTFRYQGFNPAAIKQTGISNVKNKTPAQILSPEAAIAVEQNYRQCQDAQKIISYEECLPVTGENSWWLTNLNPIVDHAGKVSRIIGTSLNITKRKQTEQALALLKDELEERVQQRTTELEQANILLLKTTATLEKRNQELDQFAYVTSHDLKAPLRAIANLSTWIEEDLADRLDENTRYNMNLLRSRVYRLENLINGLLAYSRVSRLKSEPQKVAVDEMLAEIIDLLDVPANFQIIIQGTMPTFTTAAVPLQQVFRNLISNAIQHSDCNQGKILISAQELTNCYEFTITDNGKGIDPQYHDRIFTIFQTLEAKGNTESTGIGLSIVKKAVESHGGKITVQSEEGAGATFRFTWQKKLNLI